MTTDPGEKPVTNSLKGHASVSERSASTPSPSDETDWADQVTNLVVDVVDKVRDRTTGPILEYSRALVHLIVSLIVTLPVILLLMVGVVRLLAWAVGEVWIAYGIIGVVFVAVGALLWSKRSHLPI